MSSEAWFGEYYDAVFSYILMLVKDPYTAEDLSQETFMKVIRNEHTFNGDSHVKTWIFRIAYTTTISYLRKKHPVLYYFDLHAYTPKNERSSEEIVLLNSQQKQFYEALHQLKPSYQQVILLRKIQGFSTKEASAILNWSDGKVKMSLSRALAAFKKELEKGGFTNETLI